MNTSEVLNKAADLIEERGWTQLGGWASGVGSSPSGRLCLEGAIQAASGVIHEGITTCSGYRAGAEYLGSTGQRLYGFNDEPGRTKQGVIEVLRATALIEAVREGAPISVLEPATVNA